LIVGIICAIINQDVKEFKMRYDNAAECSELGKECLIELNIDIEMKPIIYVYYELNNFY